MHQLSDRIVVPDRQHQGLGVLRHCHDTSRLFAFQILQSRNMLAIKRVKIADTALFHHGRDITAHKVDPLPFIEVQCPQPVQRNRQLPDQAASLPCPPYQDHR